MPNPSDRCQRCTHIAKMHETNGTLNKKGKCMALMCNCKQFKAKKV